MDEKYPDELRAEIEAMDKTIARAEVVLAESRKAVAEMRKALARSEAAHGDSSPPELQS